MKFFHLADLHLGKSVYEHSLLPDQRHFLDQVTAAVRAESPAAVIIAGDVFDRAVPPPEAVRLFGDFLAELKACDSALVIAVIPGNHDSAARLSFASGILGLSGVHIRADAKDAVIPITVQHGGEQARLWLLPFLSPGALPSEMLATENRLSGPLESSSAEPGLLRSQADLFSAAISMIHAAMAACPVDPGLSASRKGSADILVCHAFATGGSTGESERVFLGSAELVDPVLFDTFDYVALGHLHRCQAAGATGMYAGSPIAYAFSEGELDRGFLVVEVHPGSCSSRLRTLEPLRRMVRLSGSYDQVLQDPRWREYEGDYIEAILDDADAVLNPMGPLRERFPYLLSLKQAAFEPGQACGQDMPTGSGEDLEGSRAEDDFVAFHQELRGCPPDTALMELFSRLYREATDETT